jgi:hypothetical protein
LKVLQVLQLKNSLRYFRNKILKVITILKGAHKSSSKSHVGSEIIINLLLVEREIPKGIPRKIQSMSLAGILSLSSTEMS